MTARQATFREGLQLALVDAMADDEDVFVLGEDIADPMGGSYKITLGLSERFGSDRVRNTPISEAAIVGAALGAAVVGKRPVAEIMYVDFLTIAMDQLVNQAAFLRYMSGGRVDVPMVVRCQGGAWRGSAAQHSKNLEAWFTHIPGIRFVVPSTPNDAYWLLRWAIESPDPVIFYETNLLYGARGELDTWTRPDDLARAAVRRSGSSATVVAWGRTVGMALDAADVLASESGIELEVIDMRHLAPLDMDTVVASVRRTGLLGVVHEAWTVGGVGAEISARLAQESFYYLDGPIRRIGADHAPHPFSPVLELAMLPSVDRIVSEVRAWFDDTSRDS